MAAKGLVEHLVKGILIITPGDREDIILSAIATDGLRSDKLIAGIILTRNILPDPTLMEMIEKTSIPVIMCGEDSYKVASRINNMTVKTQPSDEDKIPIIKDLITKNIDLEVIQHAFELQD